MKYLCTKNNYALLGQLLKPVLALVLLALLAGTAPNLRAERNPNPGIAPPNSSPYGQTYGEWGAAWWQWVLGIPADRNPLLDATGEFCGENQSGPVWFLAGTWVGDVERTCMIPPGKAIFMPVYNWCFGSGVFDCDPTVPGVECDVPSLQASAAAATEAAEVLDVTVDGVPVQNIRNYRGISPGPFALTYPENSVVGVDAGIYFPQVSDGYWLMLAPLSKGEHTISMHVMAFGGDIDWQVVMHLVVE